MKGKDSTVDIKNDLFSMKEKEFGSDYKKALLDQYKLYVEMADRICSRRSSANTFFLTANTLLVTIIGISSELQKHLARLDLWWVALASIGGILLSVSWFKMIQSYCQLSKGKYLIVNIIEEKLPLAAFKAEWLYLKPEENQPRYTQLTTVERVVPIIFAGLYSVLIVVALYVMYSS